MEIILFLFLVLCVIVIAAWVSAIKLYLAALSEKGYALDNSIRGKIWFIGIFATPIAAGLYVASLPNQNKQGNANNAQGSIVPTNDELPSL